ncbi:hypothetical protein ACLM5J_09750 [Nocardioides sp. Bht2]|uniref:hypothetical protein n=1 Tax=Nocardioides sp. Bht2 TaxID=3392297 RepID=UPI0039B47F70
MGELRIGAERVKMTDAALNALQETIQNAFSATPGIFLHFSTLGVPGGRSIWVSPASEIAMTFDEMPERNAPVLLGVDL